MLKTRSIKSEVCYWSLYAKAYALRFVDRVIVKRFTNTDDLAPWIDLLRLGLGVPSHV